MTIGKKLLASSGGILGMGLLLGVISRRAGESLNGGLRHAVNTTARRQYLAGEVGAATAEMEGLERGLALSTIVQQPDKAAGYRQRFDAASSRLDRALAEFTRLLEDESRSAVDSLRQ